MNLGEKITVQAGTDAEHATDTAYTNQSYARFGESLTIKEETQSPQQKEITIPAAGGNTVNIRATVTGNTVTVKNISAHDIRTVLDAENATKELTIDCSGIADVKVTKVNLQLSSLKVIAGSEASKVNVIMSCGSIAMDKDALLYIAENMKGSSATFVIEEADENNLNEAQKETIRAEEKLIAVIDTYILSDSAKQRELGGNKVTLTVSDTGIRNYDPATLRLFEIREDGTKREISFRIVDGGIEFEADCLATYMFIN